MNQVDLGPDALWTLIPISVLAGLAAVVVFRYFSNQNLLRRTSNRLLAHLMEFRLFIDEPALVIRAQRDLLIDNWHLLRLIFLPSLILAIPFFVLIPQLESLYGRAPIRMGEPAVVTVEIKNGGFDRASTFSLKAPPAISVETPGVRITRLNQISWRIRAHADYVGYLQVLGPGEVVTKTIASGPGLHRLSEQRTASIGSFLLHPIETPFSDPLIRSVEIRYPSATIVHVHWLVWFSVVSMLAAVLLLALPGVRLPARRGQTPV